MSTDRRTAISILLAAAVPLPARVLRNVALSPEPRGPGAAPSDFPTAPTCTDLPVHDVSDHGAVGDGQADDAASIQAAIDGVGQAGVIYLSPGQFRVGSTLHYRSGVRLLGDPRSRLIQNCAVLFDQPERGFTGDVGFEGLTVTRGDSVPDDYQNRSGKGGGIIAVKLYARDAVKGFRISRCTFTDIAGRAVFVKGASDVTLVSNTFRNIYDAVELGSAGDATNYQNRSVSNLRILGNSFENVTTAVVLQGLSDTRLGHYVPAGRISNVLVSGNHFRRTIFIGVECYAYNYTVTIEGNTFEDSWGAAIGAKLSRNVTIRDNIAPQILVQGEKSDTYDFALQNVVITGNTVIGNTAAVAKKGIMIWRQAENVTIANNTIVGHQIGISIGMTPQERVTYPGEEQRDITVTGNVSHDNDQFGMHTLAATGACFANNYSYDNGSTSNPSGAGHRIDGPLVDSGIYDDAYVGRTKAGRQAIGIDIAPGAIGAATTIARIRASNNRISDRRGGE